MAEPPAPIALRTAIVHDWFQGYHGSERTVEAMRTGLFLPENPPDIFTFHAARELLPPELAKAIVRECRLSRLPGVGQRAHHPGLWRYLLPYMPYYFQRLQLDPYDLVISSSHACAVHVRPRPDAAHVCYCYTPMRYAWMPETDNARLRGLRGTILRAVTNRLREADLRASAGPHLYVAISEAVRERIRRFYGRDAVVVPPPVDTHEFQPHAEKRSGRFLWVHRLVSYKRPELVVEAFRGLPFELTMVGVGPLEETIRADLPPNVRLHGWVSRADLARLYAEASGFIHVAEEDFGITMVEALASGTPVIGLNRGGARDIVRHDVDGVLIDEPDTGHLRAAIRSVSTREWDPATLARRASSFSRARFAERLRLELSELITSRGRPAARSPR